MYNPSVWTCPLCGQKVETTPLTRPLLERAGKCQGCRLADTLAQADDLTLHAILEYMTRTNSYPPSDSWATTGQEVKI